MQLTAYMKIEYMCQTCGEHFEAEAPASAAAVLPECPSCGSRDVEREEPVANPVKRAGPYDRGTCPCAILALSGDPGHGR
jgi:putative FmdB family regulatory protein